MKKFHYVDIKTELPFDQGVEYGRQAKALIKAGIEHYHRRFTQASGMSMDAVYTYAMSYLPVVEALTPDEADEAKGIAQGAGVDIRDIMMLNCRYEITKFPKEQACTSFAVLPQATRAGGTLFGQNWDYCAGILDNIVVFHVDNGKGTRVLGVTEAGQLVRHGMNSHGVGLACNNLQSIHDHQGVEIPTCFLRRKVLSALSYEAAAAVITQSKRAVSCNFLIASRDGRAMDFETYPHGIDILEPQNGILTHANHFVVQPELHALRKSPRGNQLFTTLMSKYGHIDAEYIKWCLSDHTNFPKSVCAHPDDITVPPEQREVTVAGEIYDFDAGIAHICYGPPCAGEFFTYTL